MAVGMTRDLAGECGGAPLFGDSETLAGDAALLAALAGGVAALSALEGAVAVLWVWLPELPAAALAVCLAGLMSSLLSMKGKPGV